MASTISKARCARIVAGARQALADAADDPGRYRDGDAVERLNVYGREGEACRRCGKKIRRIIQGGRSTYFCSKCQT